MINDFVNDGTAVSSKLSKVAKIKTGLYKRHLGYLDHEFTFVDKIKVFGSRDGFCAVISLRMNPCCQAN